MAIRVSENMKYNTMVNNLFRAQDSYNAAMEKMASQKKINRPSDDPVGMSRIVSLRKSRASVGQYRRNIDGCNSWIEITESKLSSVDDLLVNAQEIAIAQSTATASAETRSISAVAVQQIMDEMLSLANSKYGDRYLFSGTRMDEEPFSSSESAAAIGPAVAADGNVFDGTVASGGGPYTGSVNKTYVVKIIDSGAFGTATYQVSSDGGKNWSSTNTIPAGGTITLGDGIDLTFTAGSNDLTTNDIFYVNASAPGYYNGNGEELSVEIGKDTPFDYSISGESVFTDNGGGNVDIFKVLNDLKNSLEANDPDGIAAQLDNLQKASEQVNENIARCGARMNRLEIAENNMADLDFNLTKLISNTEDADISEIATELAMKEIALKASYKVASKIENLTILDFLK
ncbi:MAG: flagellar hook-associated protein FlgL [Deltaproteobacteria bacterium]|nr:flagellar hook-associated protein FlgL [Deltaproteobacteria bacterium]